MFISLCLTVCEITHFSFIPQKHSHLTMKRNSKSDTNIQRCISSCGFNDVWAEQMESLAFWAISPITRVLTKTKLTSVLPLELPNLTMTHNWAPLLKPRGFLIGTLSPILVLQVGNHLEYFRDWTCLCGTAQIKSVIVKVYHDVQ